MHPIGQRTFVPADYKLVVAEAPNSEPEGVQLGLEKHFLPRRLAGIWTPLYKSKALASDP